ncbi:MAG TPA: hypothetical protein VMM56_04445, partial [Planctomycetaceae bacterium]|nr:hypothetical protein [Planctomycetaceae bacterium]
HKLRVPLHYEGRRVACPVCHISMIVGEVPPAPITESGAYRILTDCDAESFRDAKPEPPSTAGSQANPAESSVGQHCPRCNHPLERGAGRCPECKLCLDSSQKVLQKIYKAALRSLR